MVLILYGAVVVCAILGGLLVYRYDLYDREPWQALLLTAFAGVPLMRLAEVAELAILSRHFSIIIAAATAALVEELFRLAIVAAMALWLRRIFNDPMDGLIFGSILGLGMGAEESFAVIASASDRHAGNLPVEVVRLLGHLVMGGLTGFGVGLARVSVPGWPRSLAGAVTASVVLHFLWDWLSLLAPQSTMGEVLRVIAAAGLVLAGMLLYGMLVVIASARSRQIFAPLSQRTLWAWPFDVTRTFRDDVARRRR